VRFYMAFISREDFLKQQEEKQARQAAFAEGNSNGPRVGYFSLKNDGDEAIVRFVYESPDQFDILTTHQTTIDGKFRRVNCLRDFKDDVAKCPFCASGKPVQQRFYIKLIEYTRAEDGTITATPKIWERPTSYVGILSNLFAEYGDISDSVFKVKRSGEAGSLQTTYSVMLANPTVYNAQLYPKNMDAFEGYNIIGSAVLDKSFDELKAMVGDTTETTTTTGATPVSTSAPRKVSY